MKIACILTAAGNSIRFGCNKLEYPIDGKPMLEYPLELLSKLDFSQHVIVLQPLKTELHDLARKYGFHIVENDAPNDGLSRSVVLGVQAVLKRERPEGILFCVGDQPNLCLNSVQKELDCFRNHSDRIVRLASNGRVGNPIIYPEYAFDDLLDLHGDIGGSAIIDKFKERLYICNVADENELKDIDTKTEADYVCD